MRVLLSVVVFFGLVLHLPAQASEAARIARLVKQLGSNDFDAREGATRDLDALGAPALPALRSAARSTDLEVRRLAQELLERIERRVATSEALTPTLVQLAYRNVPLAEAVADLARKTGYSIRVGEGVPVGRVVSIETGKVTYWEAFAQFCEAAGVKERPEPVVNDNKKVVYLNGPSEGKFTPREVVLMDGRDTQPAARAGNLLVRALPREAAHAGQKLLPGELLLGLEIVGEPGVQVRGVVAVLIDKASDDQGQTLVQRQGATERKEAAPQAGRANLIIGGVPIDLDRLDSMDMSPKRVPVRLVPGAKQASRLTELRGTLVTQVRAPARTLATVPDVLKEKAGAEGIGGCAVKVAKAERQEDGTLKLLVQVTPPEVPASPEGAELERLRQAFGRGGVNIRGTIVIGNRAINFGDGPPNQAAEWTAGNFALSDGKGREVKPVKVISHAKAAGRSREVELHYPFPPGATGPLSLAFTAPRIVVADVPFVLKNVPLP